jgi:hypothetical protein
MKKFKNRFPKIEKAKEYRQEQVASATATFERLCPKNWEKSKFSCVGNGNGDKFLDEEYSLDELYCTLSNVSSKLARGIDDIEYLVIQTLPE